jgi:hypothetical protein
MGQVVPKRRFKPPTPRNTPKDGRIYLNDGGRLKSYDRKKETKKNVMKYDTIK